MPSRCRIGLLFSMTGPHSVIERSMLNGALLAIGELNGKGGIVFEPTIIDPAGEMTRYSHGATSLLAAGIRHVVGCNTSSSRKEVIPAFEKCDALLWYPAHYEGFETSPNVVYTGAAPNQHILPLADYLMSRFGRRAFCVGSNYIWAWENNRILREVVNGGGGEILAERYAAIGETDLGYLVDAILEARPQFVFSTFVGASAYSFFRLLRAACEKLGVDQAKDIPVACCTLCEPDLFEIGPVAMDGHISSSVYFSTIDTARNAAFVQDYADAFPDRPATSVDSEAAYVAVHLLAKAIADAGTDEVGAVKRAAASQRLDAPQGMVWLDGATMHAYLTPRIGISNRQGSFDIVATAAAPVGPDPYLIKSSPRYADARPALRVVK
ncbi:transporter substrate-binding domain-containing protein [Mesorhizobium sp. CO1-1-8]|uniref:transporter substrate-binding domain-containing protein n=1 Tax=Mesorhizobium sp. CO1-1-8 TaxID=2876631 RepID=UPI001CD0E522|nr:transporter substrate-binding domain-containing protein [Mesorhizobium sp. CO1-1-8]MBZ9772536.1 transporter substrate-binding domain-containing protein [Mesorhizobium sp. CO1-1-8]